MSEWEVESRFLTDEEVEQRISWALIEAAHDRHCEHVDTSGPQTRVGCCICFGVPCLTAQREAVA